MLPPPESQDKRFKKIIPKLELLPIERRYDRMKKTNRKALLMKYILTFLISMVPLVPLVELGAGASPYPFFAISQEEFPIMAQPSPLGLCGNLPCPIALLFRPPYSGVG